MRIIGVLLIAVVALAACSRQSQDLQVESRSAQDLFLSAERELDAGRAVAAGRLFDEVERLYPFSEWAKRAMIMSAFAYYDAQRYE